jgi:hypothetical protein
LIFKKDVSPLKKWAIVEGLAVYLSMGELMVWMSRLTLPHSWLLLLRQPPNFSLVNDDSEGMSEVFDMMGVMFITALEMLHESALIGPTSPLPDNVGVMTLFFLDFVVNSCSDYDLEWVHEVVRAADKNGVVLTSVKQVEGVDQDKLDELREICEETKKGKGLAWKTEVSLDPFSHFCGNRC